MLHYRFANAAHILLCQSKLKNMNKHKANNTHTLQTPSEGSLHMRRFWYGRWKLEPTCQQMLTSLRGTQQFYYLFFLTSCLWEIHGLSFKSFQFPNFEVPKTVSAEIFGHNPCVPKSNRITPLRCWALEIRCVMRRIFAICEVLGDLAYSPEVVSASEN